MFLLGVLIGIVMYVAFPLIPFIIGGICFVYILRLPLFFIPYSLPGLLHYLYSSSSLGIIHKSNMPLFNQWEKDADDTMI